MRVATAIISWIGAFASVPIPEACIIVRIRRESDADF